MKTLAYEINLYINYLADTRGVQEGIESVKISYNLPYEKVGENEPVCIADEVPFEIPESWEWVRLSKIVYNKG